MLNVLPLDEARGRMTKLCAARGTRPEEVPLEQACGRVLAAPVSAEADVPGFTRSTVDGYAVRACDTFGASQAVPALLRLAGEVRMGSGAEVTIGPGACAAVPTGGELPAGADAMVMLEYTEPLAGGVIAVETPTAPGRHVIFRGDDAAAGKTVLPAGRRLGPRDIGILAALGCARVCVRTRPRVAVISTGDELIEAGLTPGPGQVRDVNGPMLAALCARAGAETSFAGIVRDEADALAERLAACAEAYDLVLLSGGSSVGVKDATAACMERLGTVLFHGIAVRPGKPTLAGEIGGVPVVGLPGHPTGAYFICTALVLPMLEAMLGETPEKRCVIARLKTAIPSNDGREAYEVVRLEGGYAEPIGNPSGLISALSRGDGYVRVPRETEGLMRDAAVEVRLF